jgi:hypothetical protein
MALIFMEGFDDGLTLAKGWVNFGGNWVTGRFGGKAALSQWSTSIRTYPSALTNTIFVGAAFSFSQITATYSMLTNGMARVTLVAGGYVALYRSDNNTQIAVSTGPAWSGANVWRYIELKHTPSTGACEIRVDGILRVSGTVPTAASVASLNLECQGGGAQTYIDDLYVLDSTGATNNNYLGDVRVQTILPSADGANLALTPDSGTTHYNRLNEATPDTTSYVSSTSVGVKDSYKYQQLTANTSSVYGVAVTSYTSKDAPVAAGLATLVRMGSTDYVNAQPQVLSASWVVGTDLYQARPSDSAPWTPTDVNTAEFGVQTS